jgi:NADH-quinone oxidoreductase subunit I
MSATATPPRATAPRDAAPSGTRDSRPALLPIPATAARPKRVPRPDAPSLARSIYIVEVVKGLAVTMRHLIHNLFHQSKMPTLSYPELRRRLGERFRGRHRLMKREDGAPKCVACMCCETACPAKCISIVAAQHPDPAIEKYPVRFDINIMRCVFCGLCVEACPVDAIRMDTGKYELADSSRDRLVYDLEHLLNR